MPEHTQRCGGSGFVDSGDPNLPIKPCPGCEDPNCPNRPDPRRDETLTGKELAEVTRHETERSQPVEADWPERFHIAWSEEFGMWVFAAKGGEDYVPESKARARMEEARRLEISRQTIKEMLGKEEARASREAERANRAEAALKEERQRATRIAGELRERCPWSDIVTLSLLDDLETEPRLSQESK